MSLEIAGVIERIFGVLCCLIILFVFDRTFSSSKARWFSIHAFANLLITIFSLPAMVQWLKDPVTADNSGKFPAPSLYDFDLAAIWHPNTLWVTAMVVGVHVYHVVAFTSLNLGDIWHHLLFLPVLGGLGLFVEWGPLRQCVAFFISGFPGGVDYLNLCLMKHGLINKMAKKRCSMLLAVFVRAPGLILVSFTFYEASIYAETGRHWAVIALVVLFILANALFYMQQVVGSYYVFAHQKAEHKRKQGENGSGSHGNKMRSNPGWPILRGISGSGNVMGIRRNASSFDSLVRMDSSVGRVIFKEEHMQVSLPQKQKKSK